MAFCRLIFPILVLSVIQSCSSTQVPVFLWGDLDNISLKSNPLTKIPVGEFDAILKDELREDPFTVIFIEETLSVEDFSLKNSDGESSYPYLHANIGNSVYLPSVENALHVLNRLADPDKVDHVKLTENGLSAEIEPEGGKFLFINLKDARVGESRADLLRRHDNFIRKTFTELQGRYNKLVAVYTAHYPSWTIPEAHSRVRRQAAGSTEINVALPNLLLYAGSLKLQTDRGIVQLSNPTSNSVFRNETQLNQTLVFDNETLRLNFISSHGYWLFNTVTLNPSEDNEGNDLQATSEVYAVHGFSYRCAQQVVFAAVNTTHKNKLTFDDLKIQPFFETRNNSDTTFGDSFNCVGFFSVAIWSGLFVVFILLSITFYGIMMMMDIRTMDRFDDPKGKTITINASE